MRVDCVICGLAVLAVCLPPSRNAQAGDAIPQFPDWAKLQLPADRAELSNGFDKTASGWSGYSTAVIALEGPLHTDGWRLKLSGGYGSYHYKTRSAYCPLSAEEKKQRTGTNLTAICNDIANHPPQGQKRADLEAYLSPFGLELQGDQIYVAGPHLGSTYYAGVAPGYQITLGTLILKGYLGPGYEAHDVTPADASKPLSGGYWGAQAGIEAWLPLGEDAWVSTYASYFTGTSSHAASMMLGYKALPWLSLGPEIAAFGNEDDHSARAGGFVRVDALGMETTLSAGLSGAYKEDPSAYGSASIYMKF